MVQILPPPTSLGAEVGQAVGQGIQRGGAQALQRNQVQNALSGLQELPANASPYDLAKSLMGAFAGVEGGEKYVGQLFPLLLQQMQRRALQPGMGGGAGAQGMEGAGGTPGAPRITSAEEIQKIAQQYPGDPNDVWEYYKNQNKAIEEQKTLYRGYLQERTGATNPSDFAVLDRISNKPEFRGITDPLQKSDLVAKDYQKYEATKDVFDREAAKRPNALIHHGEYAKAIENLRSSAKPLMDHGQYDEAKKGLAAGGWSENEIAKILNPLPESTISQIKKLPSEPTRGLISPASHKQAAQAISKYEDALTKIIKPGNTDPSNPNLIEPGTSLFLLRNELQNKGVPWDQFDRILNRLIASGRIDLDPEQQRERELMTKHPSRGYSIWETLFGPQ